MITSDVDLRPHTPISELSDISARRQSPKKALLLERIHDTAADNLKADGWQVTQVGRSLSSDELIQELAGVHLLGIRSKTQVSREVIEAAPDLLAVGCFCIGTNQIDTDAAIENGVAVFNAPYSNGRSVVEMAISQIIAMTRRLPELARSMRDGLWNKTSAGSHEIRNRHLGIVGYGNIGSQLSVVAEAIGMRVSYFDVRERPPMGRARRCSSLDELLETVDTVTLHVDGRAENHGLIGAPQLAKMRPGSSLLNLSRGAVVDLDALYESLLQGHLSGAAIDVFPEEPKSSRDTYANKLASLENVILTPHIGGSTEEAQLDIGRFVSDKLVRYAGAGDTSVSVNVPSLSPAVTSGTHRVCHLHHNVPGSLADLNAVLADAGVNVAGQWLATGGQVGYVVTDLSDCSPKVLTRLHQVPGTISCRFIDLTTEAVDLKPRRRPRTLRQTA